MQPLDPRPSTVDGQVPSKWSHAGFAASPTADTPGHRRGEVAQPDRLPMAVLRLLAAVSFAGGFVLSGVQVYRVLDEQARSITLSWGALAIGLVCVAAILAWTYATVENCRRIVAPAETQELPSPRLAVASWAIPLAFIGPGAAVVVVLSRRWNSPVHGTTSEVPLLIAFGVIVVSLLLLYAPLSHLARVVRKVGKQGGNLLAWAWVPAILAVVGAGAIAGMRAFGVFEDSEHGIAPSWVVAVLLLLPIGIVFFVGNHAAREVEAVVTRAFDRRVGRLPAVNGHRPLLLSIYGAERPNRNVLSRRGEISLLPGVNVLRLGLVTLLAGLSLLSVVGAVVMLLFWRQAKDGLLLPSQRDRAWDVLMQLQSAERYVAFGLVVVTVLWSLVSVYNARVASARRRNPLLAAAAWPLAAYGIWQVGSRVTDSSEAEVVVAGFLVQAAIAYVPFFLLERAATAVGARRSPIRIVYALGVVMFVYVHGLGGLSTLGQIAETDQFGRVAGYLALGALVMLLSTLAVTEASRSISDACEHEVQHHNFLLGQRRQEDAPAPGAAALVGPSLAAD